MKKSVLAFFVCITMSLSLVACGSSDTAVATTETTTQVEETKPAVEVEASKVEEPEEKKVEEVKPTETPKPTEEPKVEEKPEEVAEEKVEETPKAEEPKPEEAKAEDTEVQVEQVQIQTEAAAPAPVAATVGTGTDLNSYIADGDFSDAEGYGKAMGAATVDIFGTNVDFNWPNYFVEINTSNNAPGNLAYIAIGGWVNGKCVRTYYCTVDFGTPIVVSPNGTTVSANAVALLPTVMNYMKNNPDPNVTPNIPGTTWSAW